MREVTSDDTEALLAEVRSHVDLWRGTQRHHAECLVCFLAARNAELEAVKDGAYLERNQLVSALSKLFPSCRTRTAIDGWTEDWHGCVYIMLPPHW